MTSVAFTDARSPDAAMIAACEALVGALKTYSECDDADEAAAGEAYSRIMTAITAARPQTMAGMVAKAKAAIHEASSTPGLDVVRGERSTPAEGWAWDLVHDLLRLCDTTGGLI